MLTEEGAILVPGVLSRYATLRNGVRAHYWTTGETGPSVLLLHGGIAGSSGLAGWRMMMPKLAEEMTEKNAPSSTQMLLNGRHASPTRVAWGTLGVRCGPTGPEPSIA